ncbi:uncharacterized protein CYBJADRAFT_167890 [Cyberlindnera jadinii NRRL Y-1542]|uniref:Hyphally-regulated cell wall protein N-terminal domain-containing protein n=1 Tax=Cyberlindnera jadinii (strain ATCC 18201 / CBS 1600 / BCRC 20928 / JCM 3617 / NBRC 0987 / NRRL Y-1542) TaxID=983966 RepID=A0A1E4S1E6_CYBJN|nr:hypothetical protein CYBJADRAFT_167890 [Cyberlindnera jadinii NRRL Y-1542]ODV73303.1 hypothetical protein CYBJADRAFT_167890 [Cyberlindnera jadinii NRRL Y-1542]
MLSKILFALALPLLGLCQSKVFDSIVVSPIDYAEYSSIIDLQRLYYTNDGDVFFYDKDWEGTTLATAASNVQVLSSGQLFINNTNATAYLYVSDIGLLQSTSSQTSIDGLFSINSSTIYYGYSYPFIACEMSTSQYHLIWRGDGSECSADNWLVVSLSVFSSDGTSGYDYFPDNYQSSIGATAYQDIYTTTVGVPTAGTTTVTSTSANEAGPGAASPDKLSLGAGALFGAVLMLL